MNNQMKKAVKTALLLYPIIMMGIGGTIMLGDLLLSVIPKDEIPSVAFPLSLLGIYI